MAIFNNYRKVRKDISPETKLLQETCKKYGLTLEELAEEETVGEAVMFGTLA
ncbi:MAG: hypothetical protein MJ200_04015 [Mycoplasmoidaceae bacterium]|nr:hypothetical protein [Mycoplasmoidaceae bacterium]